MSWNQIKFNWRRLKVNVTHLQGKFDGDLAVLNHEQIAAYKLEIDKRARSNQVEIDLSEDEVSNLLICDYQYYLSLGFRPSVAWIRAHRIRHRRTTD